MSNLELRNSKGEKVIDNDSIIGIVGATSNVSGYGGTVVSESFSGINVLNLECVPSAVVNYSMPVFRAKESDNSIRIVNRDFLGGWSPSPELGVAYMNVGSKMATDSANYGGIFSVGNDISTISADTITLRLLVMYQADLSGTTISGSFYDWVHGPTTIDLSGYNLRRNPYASITPSIYNYVENAGDHSFYGLYWYCGTNGLNFGTILHQTSGMGITIEDRTIIISIFALD